MPGSAARPILEPDAKPVGVGPPAYPLPRATTGDAPTVVMYEQPEQPVTMDPLHSVDGRLRLKIPVELRSRFREDVAAGLRHVQKALPPKYFYDQQGSQLFEQIC